MIRLENLTKIFYRDGQRNLVADRLAPLEEVHPAAGSSLRARHSSRDFR